MLAGEEVGRNSDVFGGEKGSGSLNLAKKGK